MRTLFAWLGVAALLVLSPAPARAGGPTVLKPYIVLILDVSGSMLQATGSGPPTCPGAQGQQLPDTKLNHARCAIQNITQTYGDIVFAFARFRETATGGTAGACGTNTGAPTCNLSQDACSRNSDRFQLLTALVDGANANAGTWSDFSCTTCSQTIPFAGGTNPETWNASGSTPIEGSMHGAQCYWEGQNVLNNGTGCSATTGVGLWPSNQAGFSPIFNDPTNLEFLGPTGCDPSPTCTTNCCAEQCRPYITIMLTDGDETCGGTEGHCSTTKTTLCNVNGDCPGGQTCVFGKGQCSITTTTACYADFDCPSGETCVGPTVEKATANLLQTVVSTGSPATAKKYRIQTHPIGFGTPVPYGPIENMAHAGGAVDVPSVNEGFYAQDEQGIELAISQILESSLRSEVCNGKDDDCDGSIDEDFPQKTQPCSNGLFGVCAATGTFGCSADGTGVVCNLSTTPGTPQTTCPSGKTCNSDNSETCGDGLDNDCDGGVDEGCSSCVSVPEVCNGKDDDCDGTTDEDVPTIACSNVPGAACSPNAACCGVKTCTGGSYGSCSAGVQNPPPAETCNGVDDDCDGIVDEDVQAIPCSNITGNGCTTPPCPASNNPGDPSHNPIPQNVCHPGTRVCTGGVFGACMGEVVPTDEICNALDDDCDNIIDEPNDVPPMPSVGQSCNGSGCGTGSIVCAGMPGDPNTCCQPGTCMNGQQQCGTLYCNAQPTVGDFTCDGVDDDCDGKVDEDWVCADPSGKSTPAVVCPCTATGTCNGMNKCLAGSVQCVGTPIDPTSCCDCNGTPQNGMCSGGASCAADCTCAFPCTGELGCPLGKKCSTQNLCVDDPCYNVSCPSMGGAAQVCQDQIISGKHMGVCVPACSIANCNANEVCIPATGICEPNDCRTFPAMCTSCQQCVVDQNGNGVCQGDPCCGITCPGGQYCEGGQCFASCSGVTCPNGKRCVMGQCETDPCGKTCACGEVCNDGLMTCVPDPCAQKPACPQGQACDPQDGVCKPDPCLGVMCPGAGQICKQGTCTDNLACTPDGGSHVTVGGGGCSTSGGGAGWILGIALLFMRRRRGGGRS